MFRPTLGFTQRPIQLVPGTCNIYQIYGHILPKKNELDIISKLNAVKVTSA